MHKCQLIAIDSLPLTRCYQLTATGSLLSTYSHQLTATNSPLFAISHPFLRKLREWKRLLFAGAPRDIAASILRVERLTSWASQWCFLLWSSSYEIFSMKWLHWNLQYEVHSMKFVVHAAVCPSLTIQGDYQEAITEKFTNFGIQSASIVFIWLFPPSFVRILFSFFVRDSLSFEWKWVNSETLKHPFSSKKWWTGLCS